MLPHELSDLQQLLPPLWPWGGGGRTLIRIILPEPVLENICTKVCVPSGLVSSEPSHLCLYLHLQGDIIIYVEVFDIGRHFSTGVGWIFPPVQCNLFPCVLDHVLP